MLVTWKLWRALRNPPLAGHAVFRRVATAPSFFQFRWSFKLSDRMIWIAILPIALYLIHRFGFSGILIVFFGIPAAIIITILTTPLALPVIAGLMSSFWAASITHALVKERQTHTYDLLCATPDGMLGTNWAIASGCLHQGGIFSALRTVMIAALLLGGLVLGLLLLVTVVLVLRANPAGTIIIAVRTIFDIVVILTLFYAHFVQSIVLAVLVGVFVPTHLQNRTDAPWVAFLFTAALQVGTVLIFYFFLMLIGPIVGMLTPETPLPYVGVPFVFLLFFLILRDAVVLWLWEAITFRLNADSAEREYLIRLFS